MKDYYELGKTFSNTVINNDKIKNLYDACIKHSDFIFIEIRSYKNECDTIILESCNDQVSSRNNVGIKNRERIAIIYCEKEKYPYEVRALRKDFPVTLHQNHVLEGEPLSLCLYFEPWSAVERSWTPVSFLQRILWWLSETAKGTLHRDDQPPEQLYYNYNIGLILPIDFLKNIENRNLLFRIFHKETPKDDLIILRGGFIKKDQSNLENENKLKFECVIISPPPVKHAPISRYPRTLGEFHDQIEKRGSSIYDILKKKLINSIDQNGYKSPASTIGTLLIVNFHIKRTDSSQPEKRDTRGFIISNKTLGEIGLECGAFIKAPDSSNEYYINQQIGEKNKCELDIKWKDLIIEPIEITFPQNLEKARRLSGIQNELSDFNGVIAGVGALGSQLADMWSKEGWGNWTYIDDDYIKPHNIYRHIARDCSIGQRKVNVVHQFSSLNYQLNNTGSAIYGKAHEFSNTEIETAYQNSDILIDATTTLEAPRDISLNENAPRSVSVFITPSGKSSVLLIEDKDLSIRLNSLEAQYYRAIINNEWGENHLSGHEGHIWTGAGCRDVSVIIPQELILLHAAILARHIRFLQQKSESVIRIWEVKDENGSVICHDIPVNKPIINILGEWHIVYDDFIQNKMTALRDESLPAETGGIIVGYIDQKQKYIYIVDVLNAPSDSISDNTSFVRGISGVNDELKIIMNKTANIVEYIGEWHSHPRNSTSIPSNYDINLLNYLSLNLSIEGKPGLIMIAGENDYSISLYEE